MKTLYQDIDDDLYRRFGAVRLVLSDVDGVLSDGRIYLTAAGDEIKSFSARDGAGIVSLRSCGVEFGVITGRSSALVEKRMYSLGARFIRQGIRDKCEEFAAILQEMDLTADECVYIGDDVIDIPLLRMAGIGIAVRDAHPLVLKEADLVTVNVGGAGAVREITDIILQCHGRLDQREISQ